MAERPDWGPGRTDMNPFQRQVMRLPDDHTVGSTDVMAIWNERAHSGMAAPFRWAEYHAGGIRPHRGAGGRRHQEFHRYPRLDRVQAWLMDLPAPKYAFAIDQALAAKGQPIFAKYCAECHAFGGSRTGTVVSLAEVGTDPNRNKHWPQSSADAFNKWARGYPWAFHHFRATDGYLSVPLDGVWLRAPYLHNGSVPNMRELLEPPEKRSKIFYRGYDVYDQANMGFVSFGPQAELEGFRYDTSVRGNSNQGHTYGAILAPPTSRL